MARNDNNQKRRRGRRRFVHEKRKEEEVSSKPSDAREGEKGRVEPTGNGNTARSGKRRSRRSGRNGDNTQSSPHKQINADVPTEVKYRVPEPPPKREYEACPVCQQPMRDIHSAIAFPPTGQPAHFECVLRKIAEDEHIDASERIVYLGNGSFGIVQDQSRQGKSRFFVRKRIQFEEPDRVIEWRRELSPGISRD